MGRWKCWWREVLVVIIIRCQVSRYICAGSKHIITIIMSWILYLLTTPSLLWSCGGSQVSENACGREWYVVYNRIAESWLPPDTTSNLSANLCIQMLNTRHFHSALDLKPTHIKQDVFSITISSQLDSAISQRWDFQICIIRIMLGANTRDNT